MDRLVAFEAIADDLGFGIAPVLRQPRVSSSSDFLVEWAPAAVEQDVALFDDFGAERDDEFAARIGFTRNVA